MNFGFFDGHAQFYTFNWLLSNSGGSYWPNYSSSSVPWSLTKDKF